MKFRVGVMETHIQWVTVEAEDADRAVEKVSRREGEEDPQTEYLYAANTDEWIVKEVKNA